MTVEISQRYCPICGKAVPEATYDRFGEWCCSEAHAEQHVAEIRGQKQRKLADTDAPAEKGSWREHMGCCG